MKPAVAYLLSRFPLVTETFILRELDAVDLAGALDVEIVSLFQGDTSVVHPRARRWMSRAWTPGLADIMAGALALLTVNSRHGLPAALTLVRAHYKKPRELARAVVVLFRAVAVGRRLQRRRIQLVHAHFAGNPGMAAWVISRLFSIPYTITTHAYDLYRSDQCFLDEIAAGASAVITISEFNERHHHALGHARMTSVEVIRCGVNPSEYPFRPRSPDPAQRFRILTVASMIEHKGHVHLLNALADPRLVNADLDLAGDGPLRPTLEDQVISLGLEGRVRFHGAVSEEEVSEFLARTDIFVLPSIVGHDGRMEGLPVALMEALASGVPTVATRISGIPELVRDRETGWLVDPGDSSGLAEAILDILRDPEATTRTAAAGRAVVEAQHDAARNGAELADLLSSIAATAHRR